MYALLPPKRLLQGGILLALLALLLTAQQLQLLQRSWYQVVEWQNAGKWQHRSIGLHDYRASVQAVPISGISTNLSGLTYDPDRNSLFAVINEPAQIIELSLEGQLLRRISLEGVRDAESIEYISPGVFVIADERKQRLLKVRLPDSSSLINVSDAQQLTLGIERSGNKSFEGLAYDPGKKRLFVAKERNPVQILEVYGFPRFNPAEPFAVHVDGQPRHNDQLFVNDLSGLYYNKATGHLLALSDESYVVLELNAEGHPISRLSLRGGAHGLQNNIPQAEGVTMDAAGNLYIVSEPNLFYVFKKTSGE